MSADTLNKSLMLSEKSRHRKLYMTPQDIERGYEIVGDRREVNGHLNTSERNGESHVLDLMSGDARKKEGICDLSLMFF